MLFLLIVIGVISIYVTTLLPRTEAHTPRLKAKTIDELNSASFALQDYFFDSKAYPTLGSSLTNSGFATTFFNLGLMNDNASYKGDLNYDQWGTNSTYVEDGVNGDTAPKYRKFWSVGPDFADDTAADDDIYRQVYASYVATARTRRLLAVIRASCSYYAVDLTSTNNSSDDNWAGPTYRRGNGTAFAVTGGATLGPEFDKDGWGNNFILKRGPDSPRSYVHSKGPDEADDDGGDDDIVW